jgi:phage repressor protein C with HTH and peptisase S24 domain
VSAEETDLEVGMIEYWDARGSCGGGFLNYDQMPKGHLVKEHTFFQKFGVKPSNAFAIYADGDSMANFIVDGDIVIFDRSRATPQSGKIYAIDHPDGLRIKRLRRGIDGSWTLESDNPDKRAFPDERIEPDQMDLLKIHGEFVYRQGG